MGPESSAVAMPEPLAFLETLQSEHASKLLEQYRESPDGCEDDAMFWHRAAILASLLGVSESAIYCQEKVVELTPQNTQTRIKLALILIRLKKHEEALKQLQLVAEGTPRKAVSTGMCLQEMGRHKEAIEFFELAMIDEPDYHYPYLCIVRLLRNTDSSQIEKWLERGRQKLPKSDVIGHAWCFYLYRTRRIEELAAADWIYDLEAAPKEQYDPAGYYLTDPEGIDRESLLRLKFQAASPESNCLVDECKLMRSLAKIQIYQGIDDFEDDGHKARKLLVETVQALDQFKGGPRSHEIGMNLVDECAFLGFPEGVEKCMRHVPKDFQDDREFCDGPIEFYQAMAYNNRGGDERALSLFKQALTDDSCTPRVVVATVECLKKLGRPADAITLVEDINSKKATEVPFYCPVSLYFEQGLFGKAIFHIEKRLKRQPEDPEVGLQLCFIHLLAGELENADKRFNEYCERHAVYKKESLERLAARKKIPEEMLNQLKKIDESRIESEKRNYAKLRKQAVDTMGQPSYSADLIAANGKSNLGHLFEVKANNSFMCTRDVASAMTSVDGPGFAQFKFETEMKMRGDISPVYVAIQKMLPNWKSLPQQAQNALLESERRFIENSSSDHAPEVLGYAKSVEITLANLLFGSFREKGIGIQAREEIDVVLTADDKKQKTVRLASYVKKGSKLELGTMAFFLRLCTGKTVTQSSLLRDLREFVLQASPAALDDSTLERLETLARDYRNPAAHDQSFDRQSAEEARSFAYSLLTTFTSEDVEPSAESETDLSDWF